MRKDTLPQIESLHVENYRVLKDFSLNNLSRIGVFLGPNGCGKSTILDVFSFLADCFDQNLKKAVNKRHSLDELRTKDESGPIVIEIKYRERPYRKGDDRSFLITYHIEINDNDSGPYIEREFLKWRRRSQGKPFKFLNLEEGKGQVAPGELPSEETQKEEVELDSPDAFGVKTLGQLKKHPRVVTLKNFISSWYLSDISIDSLRSITKSGPETHLDQTGKNLSNVIQYLHEEHATNFQKILDRLCEKVPKLDMVSPKPLRDRRLILQFEDRSFSDKILADYISDGTLKILAYLVVLNHPDPPPFIGLEEPENYLFHTLLGEIAEESRIASEHSQMLISTHSPDFVNHIEPEQAWVIYRNEEGTAQAISTTEIPGIIDSLDSGERLGKLWRDGEFKVGYPQQNEGGPQLPLGVLKD